MKHKKLKILWRFGLLGTALLFIIAILINFVIFIGPSFYPFHPHETIVYNQQDKLLFTRHFNEYASYVEMDDICPYLVDALVASEDKRFYKHHGLDYQRIIKSAITNLFKGEITQGGSTITQQYARTLYLNNEKSLARKLKEAWIAKKLEMTFDKEQILEGYLNCAYFGQNIYGIHAASNYYFHKHPRDISLPEAAMLIGIIKAPNYYSPEVDINAANKQKQLVLRQMVNQKMITESEYLTATNQELTYYFYFANTYSQQILYYYDAMIKQLENSGFLTNSFQKIGYSIYSCLDEEVQNIVEKTVQKYHFSSEISVIVMKPYSGDVIALIGGKDYGISSFNRATNAFRQTGSTIKPLLYYLGLESGMTPLTKMKSEPTTFYINGVGEYSPQNAGNLYANKEITMLEAIALSDNIYATKTTLLLGSQKLQTLLNLFGIADVQANPTIGLGTNSMTPLQLASIYNTLASEGAYYAPRFFRKVTMQNSNIIYQKAPQLLFTLSRKSVLQLNYMLRSPFDPAFKSYATPSLLGFAPKYRFSAKTGTTDTDRWVVGYNPQYTICVWMGHDENEPFTDGTIAKTIFQDLANSLMERHKDIFYPNTEFTPFFYQSATGVKSFTYYKK